MRFFLDLFARPATRYPWRVLAGLLAVTAALGGIATRLGMEADLAAFADEESPVVIALDRVQSEFGVADGAIQVLVDAGPGGNVLDADGIRAVDEVRQLVIERLGDRVRIDATGQQAIRSLSGIVAAQLAERGIGLAEASDEDVDQVVAMLLGGEPLLTRFISFERDLEIPTGRATFLLVELDPDLDADAVLRAAQEVQVALTGNGGLSADAEAPMVLVFSAELMMDGLLQEIEREMPILLGMAVVVVLLVLWAILRSLSELVIGFVGLLMIVIWALGLIAILGPEFLGWRGEFSQIGIVVPVVLVGLGIDYTVHLMFRYREQRAGGDEPTVAAHRAVHTVGSALVLATAATALGFASSATAPLSVIADVGIFTATGVIVAFVAMVLLVSAVNSLRGRRSDVSRVPGGDRPPDRRSPRLLAAPIAVATRAPVVALFAAGLLAVAALVVSAELETTFDAKDFVPRDSEIGRTYETQNELFGGDLAETTYVIVDGDLGDPMVLATLAEVHEDLADLENVRSVEGEAEARSIATMVLAAVREVTGDPDPDLRTLAAGIEDLRPLYDQLRVAAGPAVIAELLNQDATAAVVQIQTMAGTGTLTEQLGRDVVAAFAPLEAAGAVITVTSEQLVLAEMAEELRDFQARSILTALAAVLVLLIAYYGFARRRPILGVIALLPAAFSVSMLFGAMWALDISFNPVTSTITAISLGIGVPYGIHMVNRFSEELALGHDPAQACRIAIERTGMALTGSALTTLGAFAVLSSSGMMPVRQLGLLGALGIAFALLAAMFVEPGALALWARRQSSRASRVS